MRLLFLILLALATLIALAISVGSWRWRSSTAALVARLDAAAAPDGPARFDPRQLDELPPPVRRYLEAVLTPGVPIAARVRFTHEGTLNMGEGAPDWRPFTSTQHVRTRPPGFVWDARVRMAPGISAFVHDAYVDGQGLLHASVLGLFTVADQPQTPDLARGELLRYLAETMWYPTALLPGHGVTWSPLSDRAALATLSDGAVTVALEFHFGDDGLLESTYAPARPRTVGDTIVPSPWRGRGWAYAQRGGMRIPLEGEVAWIDPGGPAPYWRGRITEIQYESTEERTEER